MATSYNFHLYKLTVEFRDNSPFTTFEEMLKNLPANPIPLMKDGNPFGLDGRIAKVGNLYCGTFCLIQKTELPPKITAGGEAEELPIVEDEGLGHYTGFIYDPTNDCIAIQMTRNGVSPNGLCHYFRRNYNIRDIYIEIVINPTELDKLERLTSINTMLVKIARPERGTIFTRDNQPKAIAEINQLADKTAANVMTIELGIGYFRDASLRKPSILQIVRSLFRNDQPQDVQRIEIRGREGDEQSVQLLDLVQKKVVLKAMFQTVRSINANHLKNILKKVAEQYSDIKRDVDRVYKVKRKND
jgi:hypothetical protein